MSNPLGYTEIQKDVIANIISLNPTGKVQFTGTFKPHGQTAQVKSSQAIAKEQLKKTNSNEFVCDNIEQFSNYEHFQQSCNKSNFVGLIGFCLMLLLLVVVVIGLVKLLFTPLKI